MCPIPLYSHLSILIVFLLSRAVAARENATNNPPPPTLSSAKTADKPAAATGTVDKKPAPAKKDTKKSLKGVLVKKKARVTAPLATTTMSPPVKGKRAAEEDPKVAEDTKRRKVGSEDS